MPPDSKRPPVKGGLLVPDCRRRSTYSPPYDDAPRQSAEESSRGATKRARGFPKDAIARSEGQAKGELGYERTARPTGTRAEISGARSRSRTRAAGPIAGSRPRTS